MNYTNFDDYVKDNPEGEIFRNWLGKRSPIHLLCAGSDQHGSMPGGYNWATVFPSPDDKTKWWVHINDGDDFSVHQSFNSESEALQALADLHLLTPCSLNDLTLFGYDY